MPASVRRLLLLISLPLACCTLLALAADPKPAAQKSAWGDQHDGTFVNPILPSDYSDLDAIRVGNDFYAISSTFQYSPGVVILHSKDLVNWQILGHAVDDLTQIAPEHNWDKMDRYGRGIWAGALRFHAGRYYIYFGTPDEGFFMTSSTNPAGPWEKLTHVMNAKGWDDCCPFWDDDGTGYFVCTNFDTDPANGKKYNIHLFKMSPDNKSLLPGFDKIIHQSQGSEDNKLYKINGTYYHYFSENKSEGRVIMMSRAKSLDGPWETRQLNHVAKAIDKEPNQGGLIQLADNSWWFITHQGTGDWEGRAMCLLPVTWIDNWPIIGTPGPDGIGNMVWSAQKPIPNLPALVPQSDDDFSAATLAPQWEWNYQPRAEKFSLTERPGFLRLHAFPPLKPGDLLKAGNTLTQRTFRTDHSQATLKLDLSGMADGQEAGLAHLAKSWSTLGISQSGATRTRTLTFNNAGKITPGPILTSTTLYLQSTWNFDGLSQYSYSTNGKTFTPFGPAYQLTWSYYRGDRLAIYSYNNKSDAGYLDVDSFHYTFAPPPAISH